MSEKKKGIEVRELAEKFFEEEINKLDDPQRKEEVELEKETYIGVWMLGYRAGESPAEQPVAKPYDDLYRLVFSNLAKLRARTQDNERMIQMADNIRSIIEDVTNKMFAMPQTDPVNDQWQLHQSAAEQPVADNSRYELSLALRDMIKLAVRTFGDNAIPDADRKRIAAAENMLKKHSKVTDVLRAEQPGREGEAVEFHDWVEKNRWEIDHREQHTHTTTELYNLFKEQKEGKP